MPKRTNNRKKTTKTTKRKPCRRTNKTTGLGADTFAPLLKLGGDAWSAIKSGLTWGNVAKLAGSAAGGAWGLVLTTLNTIISLLPTIITWAGKAGATTLAAAAVAAGFVGPPLWDGIKYLTKTGFKSLYRFLVGIWRDETYDRIPTDNIKAIIADIKKQLLDKNPEYKNDSIMEDLSELNKLCFIIDSMNENGLTPQQYDELRQKLTDDLKFIFLKFRDLMNN